jgi:hypothetical protein
MSLIQIKKKTKENLFYGKNMLRNQRNFFSICNIFFRSLNASTTITKKNVNLSLKIKL